MNRPRSFRFVLLWAVVLTAPAAVCAAGLESLATPAEGWRVSLLGRAARHLSLNENWSDVEKLSFTVRAEPAPTRPLRLMVSLVVWDGWWYQSAELASIVSAERRHVELDLGHLSNDWSPRGHLRPWDGYARQKVNALSVSIFSPTPYAGTIHISDVTPKRAEPGEQSAMFLYDTEVVTDAPRAGTTAVVSFRLSKVYDNPFERGLVRVSLAQGDREIMGMPAFFYQDYRRTKWDTLKPVGASSWRARLTAPRAGRYRWIVTAKNGDGFATLAGGDLTVGPASRKAAPAAERPAQAEMMRFVLPRRVPRRAPVFELSAARWKLAYEEHQEPVVRAWRVPLEWTGKWGKYQGLGRYNLENAWEFDQLIEQAEAAGLRLPMALNADEPFQGQGTYNWFSNPLASHMGGPLEAPSRYFTDETVEKLFRQQVDYIASRWGNSPAVSQFELWMSVPANYAEAWHGRAGAFLGRAPLSGKKVVSRHPQGAVLGERRRITSFERPGSRWRAANRISPSTRVGPAPSVASEGSQSLKAVAGFPGEAAIYSEVDKSWHGYARLTFDVYVPKGAPNDMRAMVYVRERDWWWYETLLAPLLRPGDWTKLIVDVSPESSIWKPRGHRHGWDGYVAQNIREMGIRIFGHRKYDGPVYVDNIELWPDPHHPRPIQLIDLRANAAKVGQYEKFEVTFGLSRVFENPFDPRQADIRGHFISPSGKHVEVPGFFYQEYSRQLAGGVERLTAERGSVWKVRFATGEMGKWRGYVKVNQTVLMKDRPFQFEVVRSDNPGYIRRSRRDPQYLEFTSGKFFYPIGHNLRSPSDGRRPYAYRFATPEGKGTYIYDDYFKKMAAAGENMARIWMCSWWCGLEWNKKWHGFGGIGRYNVENAWRLDYLVEQAAKHGLYIALDTTNHGQYSIEIDHEWENNPYNAANGGFLQRAREFFTNKRAQQKYKDRLRYTIARWGYSPNIMAWTLFSEVEFVEEYWQYSKHDANDFSPHVAPWHGKMATFVRSTDPFGHVVSTHVSHPWRGHDIWARPELDLVQSNAYSKYPELGQVDVVATLSKIYHDKLKQFGRPVIIAEYGGHWMKNSRSALDAELHSGLWATAMMPYAGNTGFWWWLHVHFADRYSHYRALANYMKGEDRRGKALVQGNFLVTSPGDVLKAVGLQNASSANVWVYHQQVPTSLRWILPVRGATLGFAGLKEGAYRIEFWDTYKGVKASETTARCVGGQMVVKLPEVSRDIALKVHLEGAARTSPNHK